MRILIKLFIIVICGVIFLYVGDKIGHTAYKKWIQYSQSQTESEKRVASKKLSEQVKKTVHKKDETKLMGKAELNDENKIEKIRLLSVDPEKLILRKNHDRYSEQLKILNKDEIVKPLDYFQKWVKVQLLTGEIGWCYRTYLDYKTVPASEIFFPEIPEIDINSIDYTTELLTKIDNKFIYAVVSSEKLFLRSGYSTAYSAIDVVYKGDVLKVLGYKNNWYEIGILDRNVTGWVTRDLIQIIVDYDTETFKITYNNSKVLNENFKVNKYLLVLKNGSTIRLAPDYSGAAIAEVKRNKILKNVVKNSEWYFVLVDNDIAGWINRENVSIFSGGL